MATASPTLPAADLLPVSPTPNFAYRLVRLVGIPLLKLCFRFQVTGRENIPHSGHYVVIANHLNWLDEFALLLLFPVEPRLHFLADPTQLVNRKFQWWLVRMTGGYVPVVRERHGDRALFRHVDRCLRWAAPWPSFPRPTTGPRKVSCCRSTRDSPTSPSRPACLSFRSPCRGPRTCGFASRSGSSSASHSLRQGPTPRP